MEILENADMEVLDPMVLASPSDLTLRVVECDTEKRYTVDKETNRTRVHTVLIPRKSIEIQVDKAKLKSASKYFQAMFGSRWAETNNDMVTLHEDKIKSMEVWLRLIHSALPAMPLSSVAIPDLWHMVMAADKYEFERKSMCEWFAGWFSAHKEEIMRRRDDDNKSVRQMLFPCYTFNHAIGFQLLTRHVAYKHRGHITELNPTSVRDMHMPRRVIQQLNAAKGRLRTILHRNLFERASRIIKSATCNCKDGTIFQYLRELQRIRVWPLEDAFSIVCIDEILLRMDGFDERRMYVNNATSNSIATATATVTATATSSPTPTSTSTSAPTTAQSASARLTRPSCYQCSHNWSQVVSEARDVTANYFNGLCLDCMRRKNNIRPRPCGNDDDDYWLHDMLRPQRYDVNCRISHGEPTWYFSFMGRREKKNLVELSDEDSD